MNFKSVQLSQNETALVTGGRRRRNRRKPSLEKLSAKLVEAGIVVPEDATRQDLCALLKEYRAS